MRRWLVVALLLLAEPAQAAEGDVCVGFDREGCVPAETLAEALATEGRERVFLGPGVFAAGVSDGGDPVELIGDESALDGDLGLSAPGSAARRLTVQGDVDAVPAARLVQVTVAGAVRVPDGDPSGPMIDDAVLGSLEVQCAPIVVRHVEVGAVSAACPVTLRSSVIEGAIDGPVATHFSEHAADPDVTATDRLEPGASRIDAGDPEALAPFEPFEDLEGDTRITDGDGDGVLRRDVGAQELQPPPVPLPAGNVLANPGAEDGLSGWAGTFTTAAYGSDPFLPGERAAAALDAGGAFFTAAGAQEAQLLQRIDLTSSAAAVDTGGATAALSGLLGGYGDDPDRIGLSATFRDPEGAPLGELVTGPVTALDRGRATNLLHRSASGAIPARTRAIDVTLTGERLAGAYTDAYADQLALVLSVPGVPIDPPKDPADPVVPGLRPFGGVTVLTARPAFTRRWRAKIAVACPDATVIRCKGVLELRARLPRTSGQSRIAHFLHVSLAAGEMRSYRLRMLLAARRALKGRRAKAARLVTVSTDGQGVLRQRTVALRLRLPHARR